MVLLHLSPNTKKLAQAMVLLFAQRQHKYFLCPRLHVPTISCLGLGTNQTPKPERWVRYKANYIKTLLKTHWWLPLVLWAKSKLLCLAFKILWSGSSGVLHPHLLPQILYLELFVSPWTCHAVWHIYTEFCLCPYYCLCSDRNFTVKKSGSTT